MLTPDAKNDDRRPTFNRGGTIDKFRLGRYVPIPQVCLMPYYIMQVGATGLLFLLTLILGFDLGRFRHKNQMNDDWFAMSDEDIRQLWGTKTTAPIRKARKRVLKATPAIIDGHRPGRSGHPSEYRLRTLTEVDAPVQFPQSCIAMPARRRRAAGNQVAFGERATDMLGRALEYRNRGFSVIPLDGKQARVKWKEYQERPASEHELVQWRRAYPQMNLGIVTGAVSNLVVVDIDGDAEAGYQLLREHGIQIPPTTVVRTGKGIHLWFTHPGTHVPSASKILTDGKGLNIDIRGDGGYVVVPPSVHPATGCRYIFEEEVDELPALPPDMLASALDVTGTRSQKRKERNWSDAAIGPLDAKRLLAKVDLVKVIQACGTALVEEAPDRYRGQCPFHEDSTPSLVVTPSKGLWNCFGCSVGGNAAEFLKRHKQVDFAGAIRELEKMFGDQETT